MTPETSDSLEWGNHVNFFSWWEAKTVLIEFMLLPSKDVTLNVFVQSFKTYAKTLKLGNRACTCIHTSDVKMNDGAVERGWDGVVNFRF